MDVVEDAERVRDQLDRSSPVPSMFGSSRSVECTRVFVLFSAQTQSGEVASDWKASEWR